MTQELQLECPECDEELTFRLVARTTLHLGEKRKWRCPECSFGFVRIDDTVDTSATA